MLAVLGDGKKIKDAIGRANSTVDESKSLEGKRATLEQEVKKVQVKKERLIKAISDGTIDGLRRRPGWQI